MSIAVIFWKAGLPQLIPDTAAEPLAMSMPITKAASIGAHVSVPIRLPNGQTYGMFCCIGFTANPSLNERDLQTMKAFAEIAAFEINRELEAEALVRDKRAKIERVIGDNQLSMAFQPIWNVEAEQIVGFESLARFCSGALSLARSLVRRGGRGGHARDVGDRGDSKSLERVLRPAAPAVSRRQRIAGDDPASRVRAGFARGAIGSRGDRNHRTFKRRKLRSRARGAGASARERVAAGDRRCGRRLRQSAPHPAHEAGFHQARHRADPEYRPRSGASGAHLGA